MEDYARLYRITRVGFVSALLVTLGVLLVGVVPGIVVGVMLSLMLLLGRLARPADAVLQQIPGTAAFHDLGDTSATETVPGMIAYRGEHLAESTLFPSVHAAIEVFLRAPRATSAAAAGKP